MTPREAIRADPERGSRGSRARASESREEDAPRTAALRHLKSTRKFKRYLATYLVLMIVLTATA